METLDTRKLLCMLGFASKARKLLCGTDMVCEAVRRNAPHSADHRKGSVGVVMIASDASENTRKRIGNCCSHYHVPCVDIPVDRSTLSHAIGRMASTAVCAVFDQGFLASLARILSLEDNRNATIHEERKATEAASDAAGDIYDNEQV